MIFEAWVWTELLAFDSQAEDFGVQAYLDTLGFVPKVACLLFSSPDFFLLHEGMAQEYPLSPLVCSRHAHPGNEAKKAQSWTNYQLRALIARLKEAGTDSYISCFPTYFQNRYYQEWMGLHPEAREVYAYNHRGSELNVLQVLADGTLVEDIVVEKVVQTCLDYGYAGWHGPDGWGPLAGGNLMSVDFSDGMMQQFLQGKNWQLPECLKKNCPRIVKQEEIAAAKAEGRQAPDYGLAQLQERANWIWQHKRKQWIEFMVERWTKFWDKMSKALHQAGLKNAINSAWTKGNFDALYEYGIDYRKMAALGIDAMVVETVALGMSQLRPTQKWYHDDYAMSLAEIKAAAPNFKLIFLHGIKDIVEYWDNLRHATPGYERELYKLTSLYYLDEKGLRPSADGLLACLADGIAAHEWDFIRQCWSSGFVDQVSRAGEATVLWHDCMLDEGVDDFMLDGFLPGQKQLAALQRAGLALQTFARLENADSAPAAVLVPSAHLLPAAELQALLARHSSPVILCGRAKDLQAYFNQAQVISDGRIALLILNAGKGGQVLELPSPEEEYVPTTGSLYFSHDRARQAVDTEFWRQAVPLARKAIQSDLLSKNLPYAEVQHQECSLLCRDLGEHIFEVAIENRVEWAD